MSEFDRLTELEQLQLETLQAKLDSQKYSKATKDLAKMSENYKKYGEYILEPPKATNRAELYRNLQIDNVFNEINDKYAETQNKIQKVAKDGRYKDEFKGIHKQKTLEEFQQFKESKLNEIKDKMNVYRSDIEAENKAVIEDKGLEATNTNTAMLQLMYLDSLDNNTELMRQFVNENWNRKDVMSLVEAKYKDNAAIVSQIAEKKKKEYEPYKLVDSCIRDIDVFISNKDYNVNSDYIENGITKFDSIDGGANE